MGYVPRATGSASAWTTPGIATLSHNTDQFWPRGQQVEKHMRPLYLPPEERAAARPPAGAKDARVPAATTPADSRCRPRSLKSRTRLKANENRTCYSFLDGRREGCEFDAGEAFNDDVSRMNELRISGVRNFMLEWKIGFWDRIRNFVRFNAPRK